MTDRIPYHLPGDKQFSLAFVTQDRDEIHTGGGIVRQYDLDEEFFVLYTDHGTSGTVDDIDDEFDEVLDEMGQENRVIAVRLLQIFEGIIDEKELAEGEELEIYKQVELGQVPNAISHVDWSHSAVDVAGQLMSTLVLKHALPNANHRTSISLAEWYLESVQSGFSLPKLATDDYAWRDWVDEYIRESKRILTVRRNTRPFSMLQQWGCDVIERKGNVEIDLLEYDLEYPKSAAYRHYGEAHAKLCTEVMKESVQRAGHDELLSIDGPTKDEFVGYLEEAE